MKHEVEASLVAQSEGPDDESITAEYRFDAALSVFAGHFPNVALVPGVYLIEAARLAAERHLDRTLRIAAVENARFTAEVHPDDRVHCVARISEAASGFTCEATLTCRDATAAKIRLRLAPAAES